MATGRNANRGQKTKIKPNARNKKHAEMLAAKRKGYKPGAMARNVQYTSGGIMPAGTYKPMEKTPVASRKARMSTAKAGTTTTPKSPRTTVKAAKATTPSGQKKVVARKKTALPPIKLRGKSSGEGAGRPGSGKTWVGKKTGVKVGPKGIARTKAEERIRARMKKK
jgi:hypothetical protein